MRMRYLRNVENGVWPCVPFVFKPTYKISMWLTLNMQIAKIFGDFYVQDIY